MSHATRDCLERPRAKGARYTGKNIAADDKIQTIEFEGFDSKRDRWNGFDSREYAKARPLSFPALLFSFVPSRACRRRRRRTRAALVSVF
jgi:hypothetical protein